MEILAEKEDLPEILIIKDHTHYYTTMNSVYEISDTNN